MIYGLNSKDKSLQGDSISQHGQWAQSQMALPFCKNGERDEFVGLRLTQCMCNVLIRRNKMLEIWDDHSKYMINILKSACCFCCVPSFEWVMDAWMEAS